jgi:acyl dehydratase
MDGRERYFEDWNVGETLVSASRIIDEAQIVAFAREYDPQPFHLDPEAAKRSPFGGLIASGWQTASVSMRLIVDGALFGPEGGIGLGVDELRWPRPVFPGDELHVVAEVLSKAPSRTKRAGVINFKLTTRNQRDEDVMTQTAIVMVANRPEGAK